MLKMTTFSEDTKSKLPWLYNHKIYLVYNFSGYYKGNIY